ncbi:Uncharacterised protein [Segatella copri]|nr:Uncharacterised protein [Segatella copri]
MDLEFIDAKFVAGRLCIASDVEVASLFWFVSEEILAGFGRNRVIAFFHNVRHVDGAFLYLYHFRCGYKERNRQSEVDSVCLFCFCVDLENSLAVYCLGRDGCTIYICTGYILLSFDLELSVFLCFVGGVHICVIPRVFWIARVAQYLCGAKFDFHWFVSGKSCAQILGLV